MSQEDDAKHLRLALGRQLATWRDAAQESQHSLAGKLPFSRSTVANVETGRQAAPREFWERCDDLLGAGGALLAGYDQLAAAIKRRARADAQRLHVRQAAVGRTAAALNADLEPPTQILARRATLHTSNLTAELLSDLEQLVADVVERYEIDGPLLLAPEAVRARQLVDQLLAGNQRLDQRARLFEVAGRLSGQLSYMAINLGKFGAARAYGTEAVLPVAGAFPASSGHDALHLFRRLQRSSHGIQCRYGLSGHW